MDFSSYIKNKENFFTGTPYGFVQENSAEKNDKLVTIPMVEKAPVKEQSKLDTTGNIPMVQNVKADETMGLGVEKTAVKKENPEKTTQKTGESVNDRLSRYYSKYKNATREQKSEMLEKYITQHYSTLKNKPRSEQIKIQLADFKKLIANTKDGDDYEMLAEKINILENENQVLAAKNATTEQPSTELKRRGEIGVSKTIHKCHSDNQTELTQLVADSNNEEAIKIGASHVSELADQNETVAVNIYKTADISEKAKTEVGKTIIAQYADFAKENQVDIHESMSDKNYWNTNVIEFAASNIYNFATENQKAAIQITINTGNEAAINAAAAKINYYDKSVQSDAKTMFNSTSYSSVKETLENAPQPPAQDAKVSENTTSTSTAKTVTQETFQKANITEKIKMLSTMNVLEKQVYIKEMIKYASNSEKLALLSSSPSPSVISLILDSNPSLDVLSKIKTLVNNFQDKDKKPLLQKLNNSYTSSLLTTKTDFSLFGQGKLASAQKNFITE